MIIGVGHDLCQINRFKKLLDKKALLIKIFHHTELSIAEKRAEHAARYLAGSWAAKESLSKAMSIGIFDWHLPDAAYLTVDGSSRREWFFMAPFSTKVEKWRVNTSLSYELDLASAITIIEEGS